MKKFYVAYMAPASVIAEWMKTDPKTRKEAEEKMQAEWRAWMEKNKQSILETQAGGKTKRVTDKGTIDTKNDIMLYCVVEAESHEAAANIFKDHPHLQIPQSSIEVMEIRPM